MADWKIFGEPRRYSGGASESADVDFGLRVDVRKFDGRVANVYVERAKGSEWTLTPQDARQAVEAHLDKHEVPSRILLTRQGEFIASD